MTTKRKVDPDPGLSLGLALAAAIVILSAVGLALLAVMAVAGFGSSYLLLIPAATGLVGTAAFIRVLRRRVRHRG
ncbi:MAG: hypothetical protein HY521_01025 [Proteobacteria bacterium]|nr:hypothetical protein [Pseudomonadota bacterium]